MGRGVVAAHRQQHHVDLHAWRQRLHRFIEQSQAAARVDVAPDRRWRRALRGQAVGDQDHLIRRGRELADRAEGVDETRAVLRHYLVHFLEHPVDRRLLAAIQPLSGCVREQRRGLRVEAIHLELARRGDLRREPADCPHAPPPLRSGTPRLVARVAQADDIDDVLVKHACRRVDQHQNVPAAHTQPRDVTAVRAALRNLHRVARRPGLLARGLQAPGTLLQRADIGLQLPDMLTTRDRGVVVDRALVALLLQLLDKARGARRCAHGFTRGFRQRVAQHHEVLRALEHLLLEETHLRGQILGPADALDATLRADDHVEKDDRAEAAADAVEEREAEDLSLASLAHRRLPR